MYIHHLFLFLVLLQILLEPYTEDDFSDWLNANFSNLDFGSSDFFPEHPTNKNSAAIPVANAFVNLFIIFPP